MLWKSVPVIARYYQELLPVEYQKYLKAKAEKKSSSAENSVTWEHPNDMTNFSWVHECINLMRASLIEIRTSQTRQGHFSDHFDYLGVRSTVRYSYVRTYVHRAGSHRENLVCKIENASTQQKSLKKKIWSVTKVPYHILCNYYGGLGWFV